MQKVTEEMKLDFDDVLIRPKRSKLSSRSEVVLNREFLFPHSTRTLDIIPLIAANMDTTGSIGMADVLDKENCCSCLHKHYSSDELIEYFSTYRPNVFYSTGTSKQDMNKLMVIFEHIHQTVNCPVPNVCVDVANGYSEGFVKKVRKIRDAYPDTVIMAGNVVTPEMTEELILHGKVDIVKVGIGSGSVCTTRLKTGIGYPQLSAVMECAYAAHGLGGHICSDGGCKTPADICKAFGGNADFVMLGSMLAGTDCCEGEWKYNEKRQKQSLEFYGMSSKQAMNKHNGGVADYRTSEGKCVSIPYKGTTIEVIKDILGGMRSSCTYVGAKKIKDFGKKTSFIRVNNTHNKVYET